MRTTLWILFVVLGPGASAAERITSSVSVERGPVNGVLITRNGKTLAVYGDPRQNSVHAEKVLFTHHRRDVAWAGRAMVERGAEALYPAAEEQLFTGVREFWAKYSQFHDYANQSSKVLATPVHAGRGVRGGDHVAWNGLDIEVRDTPGLGVTIDEDYLKRHRVN